MKVREIKKTVYVGNNAHKVNYVENKKKQKTDKFDNMLNEEINKQESDEDYSKYIRDKYKFFK